MEQKSDQKGEPKAGQGGAEAPPVREHPNPLPKLSPDAPQGAAYQLGRGIFVDENGMEVKPRPRPSPRPAPQPSPRPAPQVNPAPKV